jgi:predicted NBD/HSP70 family sugar kinase
MSTSTSRPVGRLRADADPLADEVLRLIWQERRIARAEIARRLDLARSTVSEIVRALLETGLVAEAGEGTSRGGRPPILLAFEDEALAILGVDIGASHVAVALTDLRGRVLLWEEASHPVRTDPAGARALVERLCDSCLAAWGKGTDRLVGIGVSIASPVDPERPGRLPETVLPAWEGELGLDPLSRKYDAPLLVDNDANLGALAERWWGASRGVDDFAYIKLATGIGSGHVIRGSVYRGAKGIAGEIGHVVVDPHGPPCVCGLRGCLTTYVGSEALARRARELLADHPGSVLATGEPTAERIAEAALAGDPAGLRVVHDAAESLGVAVAGMLNILNPAVVVFGGGLARVGDLLLEPLREVIRERTLVSSLASTELRVSELGPRATAIGAATLVLEAALADPRLFPHVYYART